MRTKLLYLRAEDNNRGFTLLEVMISVAFFGLIMLYVSQIMYQEIRLFNSASKYNDLQQNTRSAMMHMLDELRLHHSKELTPGEPFGENVRVFGEDEANIRYCLICTDQSGIESGNGIFSFSDDSTLIIIYLDKSKGELWYQDHEVNQKKLIANHIKSIKLLEVTRILTIELVAEDPSINQTFKLVTAIRLL